MCVCVCVCVCVLLFFNPFCHLCIQNWKLDIEGKFHINSLTSNMNYERPVILRHVLE